ncbi:MAG: hypothetical protein ACTSYM_05540 [Candidatus Baldrarchaeia archaeon]
MLGTVGDYSPKGLPIAKRLKLCLGRWRCLNLPPRTLEACCYALFMEVLHSSKCKEESKAIKMLNFCKAWLNLVGLQIPLK